MQFTSQFKIYILTIYDDDHPRIINARAQLDPLGIEYTIVKGVRPSIEIASQYYSKIANFFLAKRSLSFGEICCYVGHRMMWQRFIETKLQQAIFLEDDFNIIDLDVLRTAIPDCLSSTQNWDVIKFFDFRPKNITSSHTIGTTNLVSYKYPASGNVGYMMNRHAAEALLKRKKIFRPVDEDMAHMWEFGIRIWSVVPNPMTEKSHLLGGSTIDYDRKNMARERSLTRSLWGNVLQGKKLFLSILYRRKMKFKDH